MFYYGVRDKDKIGGIRLGLCGIRLDQNNKENFVYDILLSTYLDGYFVNFQ